MSASDDRMEKIISLAKRRGFIYQGSEVYGGLAGTWDYGPYGVALKNNIKDLWWSVFVDQQERIYGVDASILMHSRVWQASGHAEGFTDPLVECNSCKKRFRADHLPAPQSDAARQAGLEGSACPECGGELTEERAFNMMFATKVGAAEDSAAQTYLRPETAQGIFVNFKNVVDSLHPKLPFGIAQIGKAFRNEITPRDFLFRMRELEQMEVEYFVHEEGWEEAFEMWRQIMWRWIDLIGIPASQIHEHDMPEEERAHYSKRTIDFEYQYPFGQKELYGLAYRTDYDLKKHMDESGVDLRYIDSEGNKFLPHVIEPSLGLDRTILAVLLESYTEEELENGDTRVSMRFSPHIAPTKVAVFPLLKNKPELVEKAEKVYQEVKRAIPRTAWDDNGNIGKRYRRQDEVGTPFCVTVDFDSFDDESVTVRHRDTMTQERIAISELVSYLTQRLEG